MSALRFTPVLLALLGGGCNADSDADSRDQGRQVLSTLAKPVPPGAVPLGTADLRNALAPPNTPPSLSAVKQGARSYEVFCTPCHGASGHGDGAVVARGFPKPPSFHEEGLLQIEPSRIVAVISDGKGVMLPMAERIPPAERWSIAHYVKALQLAKLPPRDNQNSNGGGKR